MVSFIFPKHGCHEIWVGKCSVVGRWSFRRQNMPFTAPSGNSGHSCHIYPQPDQSKVHQRKWPSWTSKLDSIRTFPTLVNTVGLKRFAKKKSIVCWLISIMGYSSPCKETDSNFQWQNWSMFQKSRGGNDSFRIDCFGGVREGCILCMNVPSLDIPGLLEALSTKRLLSPRLGLNTHTRSLLSRQHCIHWSQVHGLKWKYGCFVYSHSQG